MGGACGKSKRKPEPRPEPRPTPTPIRGSKWVNEKELEALTTSNSSVSVAGVLGPSRRAVDWTRTVLGCARAQKISQAMSGSRWLHSLAICVSARQKRGAAKLKTHPGGGMVAVKLQSGQSVLKLKKVPVAQLKKLVVTSIRCKAGEVIDRGFFNPYPLYCGDYDLDCLPRCAILVGYNPSSWTVYDPDFKCVYRVPFVILAI